MAIIDHRTLRSRATDQEALAERAQKLFIVPTELTVAEFAGLSAACQSALNPLYPLPLVADKRVLRKAVKALSVTERYRILDCRGLANGIKLAFVSLAAGVATLEVEFYNRNYLKKIIDKYDTESPLDPSVARRIFSISGGHRLIAGAAAGQVQVRTIAKSADFDAPNSTQPTTLRLTAAPIGDYSTYTLAVNVGEFPAADPVIMDPVFNEIDFKFRPGCFTCKPDWEAAQRPPDEPAIDYRAKDYDSFRHTMIAALMQRVPDWQPSSEADLDHVLLDLFSAAADGLSDYQDRVMNEAYLASARKRVSLARHARLMDYHVHQGNQASTWLALEVMLVQHSEPEAGETRQYFLADNFKVWSGTPTEDASSVVFLSRTRQRVHQLVNRMGLYTWSDSIPSLAAGDTSADLTLFVNQTPATDQDSALVVQTLIRSGVVTQLLIQEHLNPATGTVNGRDPRRRQILQLLPGDEGAEAMFDPTTGPPASAKWFVRVRWREQDALRSNYCFTVDCCGTGKVENVSLFHGNLVEVHQGRLRSSVFKEPGIILTSPDEFHYERIGRWDLRDEKLGKWGTLCALPDHPLAYRNTELGGDVPPLSTLFVNVQQPGGGTDTWDEVPSFIHSDDSDENGDHFVVETDEGRLSYIRFGNGKNGKELPEAAEVHCTYQVGDGLDGNIGLDCLVNFDPPGAFLKLEPGDLKPTATADGKIIRSGNPFDVTNGRAPEPAAAIIRRAPEAYRLRQLRAITLQDYVNRAQELSGVSRAAARYAWTGSWRTVQIAIDPVGTTVLTEAARLDIARYLNAVRLIGEDLEIRPPRFVPLEIHVSLCAGAEYWPEDLKSILEQELSSGWTPDGRMSFFHPDLWTFGQPLKASQILGRVLAVEGVEHVITVTMRRWNGPATLSDEVTAVAHDEIIQVVNDPDHHEKGFIDFDVQGGRR